MSVQELKDDQPLSIRRRLLAGKSMVSNVGTPSVGQNVSAPGGGSHYIVTGTGTSVNIDQFAAKLVAPASAHAARPKGRTRSTTTLDERDYIALLRRVEALEAKLEAVNTVIDIREIDDEAATEAVKALFEDQHGKVLYASDISVALSLDYEQVTRAIERLSVDGEIGEIE